MSTEPSTATAARRRPAAGKVEGFVESMSDVEVAGWAIHGGESPVTVELVLEGEPLLAELSWYERNDVAAAHGPGARLAGFRLRLAETEAAAVKAAAARGGRLDVVAVGVALPRAAALERPLRGAVPTVVAIAQADGEATPWANDLVDEGVGLERVAESDPNVVGFVESVDGQQVTGWAFDRTGAAVQLTLAVGDEIVESERLVWVKRPDVAAAHAHVFERCGFLIPFGPDEAERAQRTLDEGGEIHVLANGFPLPVARRGEEAVVPVAFTAGSLERARLERAARFVISGWAVDAGGAPARIEVRADGEPLECLVLPRERPELAEGLGIRRTDVGFDLEVPPSVWARTHDAPIRIEVLADGTPIADEPLLLTRTLAATWVGQLIDLPHGPERDSLSLLAIQHIGAAGLLELLDGRALLQIRWFAGRAGLERFLHRDDEPVLDRFDPPAESETAAQMRIALHELNRRLTADPSRVIPPLREVLADPGIGPEVRGWLLNLGAQLACGTGEFLQMRELMDFDALQRCDDAVDPYPMSLGVAALVADSHVRAAARLLARLSKRLSAGWVVTECLRFAVGHVARLEGEGTVEPEAADEFRRALVAVLGAYGADWYGRLHDEVLVDAFVTALAGLDRYVDEHRALMATAAVWHYGLSPVFWSKWQAIADRPRHPDLDAALVAWTRIETVLRGPYESLADGLPSLAEPLEFFHRRGNPEAVPFAREFVLGALLGPNRPPEGLERRMLGLLLEADVREALRVAAYPTLGANAVRAVFAETADPGKLVEAVKAATPRPRSRLGGLRAAAAAALERACAATAGASGADRDTALAEVEACASRLMRADVQYLGVDLLAGACVLAAQGGESGAALGARLDRLAQAVRRVVDEPALEALPVPVETAVQAIGNLAADAATAVNAIREQVQARFEIDDEALAGADVPSTPSLPVGGVWPGDTLVVIESCRAHLESRVVALRETWLPRLAAAGIPCVIVVGDGDDRLEGDVLALAVPDGYEHRPRKTLATLGWVLRHTAARFVVKLEDDCQLDVDGYFRALGYRRFAYYGRIVRHRPGELDRVGHGWHVAPRPGEAPVFDRSPDGSSYCDGRVGYALSRGACAALLAAAATPAGRRLAAVSTREDKLVGDLLASAGIAPAEEDFEFCLQVRLQPDAVPVGVGAGNGFDLSSASPAQVSHRGRADGGTADDLFPKRIWPTTAAPSLGAQGNALQLLTPPDRAHAVLDAPHAVVAVVRNERELVPHFLAHYRALGLQSFLVADNGSTDGTREFLLAQPDVVLYSADTDYRDSHFGVAWQQAMLAAHCLGKWVILADADELLVYEDSESRPFADLVTAADYEGADAFQTLMIDLYPKGPLDAASFASAAPFEAADHFDAQPLVELRLGRGRYSNVTNRVNGLRHRIAPTKIDAYTSQKCAVLKYRPWVRLSEGIHYAANVRLAESPAFFAHFKYHAAFKQKVAEEVRRKQHFNNAEEYRHFASILAPGSALFAPGVSKRYRSSTDFMAVLDPEHYRDPGPEEEPAFGTPDSSAGHDAG